MRILVIGGAGYIGSHVALELLDAGHEVTVFDNLSSGRGENLFAAAKFIEGDILDAAALRSAMKGGFDALIHLAAFKAAGESMSAPEKYSENNISGTINILNTALESNIKHVVFSSSAAVYGSPRYLPIDEEHPVDPENYYGFTKLEIERIMQWYGRLKGLCFASLRYFNAAGYDARGRVPGLEQNPANLLPVVMEAAAGMRGGITIFGGDYDTPDGTCVRDYIHVSDLARAHLDALKYITGKNTGVTVNLGSETGISVREMVEAAKKITGADFKITEGARRAGDPAKLTSSAALARRLFGWAARESDIETLVKSTWRMYSK
ncbi:MAG: UDP-glucose 4-epimerase GalE [Spirochaetaceae bacterium]|jgi:UDP-glucose 4-epimerase|nr:UDP-glucose 4-epimerase GalE [Spirochaetaceae bacterium]